MSSTPSNAPVVLLGASYLAGWHLSDVAGRPVVNKAIGGLQTFELIDRFGDDVLPLRPRAVVIWGFLNDLFRVPKTSIEYGLGRACRNIERLVKISRSHGIEPVLATELTICPPDTWRERLAVVVGPLLGKQSFQASINQRVLRLNDFIRNVAARERLLLLDLCDVTSGPGGWRRPEFASDDGSHVTPAGYAAITAYAHPLLEEHLTQMNGFSRDPRPMQLHS